MKEKNDDMSEDSDSKLNLDKDDEDDSDFLNLGYNEIKSIGDRAPKSPPGAPKINPIKSPKFSDFLNPYFSLFGKHDRSFESSNSSIDEEETKKKKVKELTSFQKSYVQSQFENYEKNYKILKEDFKLLEEYETKIFKDTNLDIMFIMDLTGSMGIWLNEAKKSVKNIIEEITDNNPGAKIRMSFIGYRDFLEKDEKRKYDSQEFTENIDEFNNFLSKLDCNGGGDEPEDVVGALKQALQMNWISNAKYAVLVCDAPCHGKVYHNISYDRFSEGDPDGKLEDVVRKFNEKGITFYCIEINNTTKKMFNIMRDIYNDNNKFHVEKLGNSVHQFSFFVAFSASVLLGNAKYSKYKFNDILDNYRKENIEKIMKKYINGDNNLNIKNNNNDSLTLQLINQIENLELGGEDKKLFDFINRMNDLDINNENKINNYSNGNIIFNNTDKNFITIIDEEKIKTIEKKEINYILRALSYNKNLHSFNDWNNPTIQEKIFKTKLQISFDTFKKDNNNQEYCIYFVDKLLDKEKMGKIPFLINYNLYNNPSQYIKKLAYDELICEQIADYFNILMEQNLPYLKQFIKFQRHILYELEDQNSLNNYCLKNKYIISEDSNSIQLTTAVIPTKRTLQSYSHFSYQITGGQLIITDIKYDNELKKVTDFKIYSLKENGYKKILEFFSSHICDNTCKKLQLAHPRKKLNPIIINESFYSDKYLNDYSNLCLCCSVPFHLKEDKKGNKSLNCGLCSWKESISKVKSICTQCKMPFSYSSYAYNCQLINYPTKCEKCNKSFLNINI